MKVIRNNPVPIYEATCGECGSVIEYKKVEISVCGTIDCPVCGCVIWANALSPVRYERNEAVRE